MIKAIIFDIDGVLLDSFEANLKFFQDLMEKFNHQPPTRKQYVKWFHFSMYDAIMAMSGVTDEDEVQEMMAVGRSREDVAYRTDLVKMPKGAPEVIKNLSQKYRLGIVTSRVKESVYEFPQLAVLKKYFQTAVSYDDTEKHKPDPEPLLLAAKRLGIKPSEAVYIGDVKNDLVAGRAAGMKVIIYSKSNIIGADGITDNFAAISKLIKGLD